MNLLFHVSGVKFLCCYSAHIMSAIFQRLVSCTVFANCLENKSRSEEEKYTTFINSSWGISGRKMREINFSSMCHIFVIPRGLRGHSLLKEMASKMAEHLTSIIVLNGFKLKKSTLVGCKMKQKLDLFNRVAQERETTSQ